MKNDYLEVFNRINELNNLSTFKKWRNKAKALIGIFSMRKSKRLAGNQQPVSLYFQKKRFKNFNKLLIPNE